MSDNSGPILILGKDGQVGTALQGALAQQRTFVALGRSDADLGNVEQLRDVTSRLSPRLIVNAAAYTGVDRAEQEGDLAMRVNGIAPGLLAAKAALLGIPLVHYSTDYVFDGVKALPYVEDDSPNPQSVYGRSKLVGEEAICKAGASAVIFRTSWVFGESGGNFVKTILRLAHERTSLRVVADQIGAPTPAALIADVTARIISLFDHAGWPSGTEIYHLAPTNAVSWHAFAQKIVTVALELGFPLKLQPQAIEAIPTEAYPLPAQRPKNSRLDCTKLEARLGTKMPGWEPYLERMLKRMVAG